MGAGDIRSGYTRWNYPPNLILCAVPKPTPQKDAQLSRHILVCATMDEWRGSAATSIRTCDFRDHTS
jgi:hypothetical protein